MDPRHRSRCQDGVSGEDRLDKVIGSGLEKNRSMKRLIDLLKVLLALMAVVLVCLMGWYAPVDDEYWA